MGDALAGEGVGHGIRGLAKERRLRKERRDVLEDDSRLREVGHVAYRSLDAIGETGSRSVIGRHRSTPNGFIGSVVGSPCWSSTTLTRAPDGPVPRRLRSWRKEASSPSASTSTDPSTRLRTQPVRPSALARSRTNQRNPTPCTLPRTTTCNTRSAPLVLVPAVMSHERYKSDRSDFLVLELTVRSVIDHEALLVLRSSGHQHSAPFGDLREQRFRHRWRA